MVVQSAAAMEDENVHHCVLEKQKVAENGPLSTKRALIAVPLAGSRNVSIANTDDAKQQKNEESTQNKPTTQ